MEFRQIHRIRPGDNQVSIAVTQRGVSVTIPGRVAAAAGLTDAKTVALAYGEDRKKRCIQVRSDPNGSFTLASRGPNRTVMAQELRPKRPVEGKKSVQHEAGPNGLVITLPEGWELADQGVIGG